MKTREVRRYAYRMPTTFSVTNNGGHPSAPPPLSHNTQSPLPGKKTRCVDISEEKEQTIYLFRNFGGSRMSLRGFIHVWPKLQKKDGASNAGKLCREKWGFGRLPKEGNKRCYGTNLMHRLTVDGPISDGMPLRGCPCCLGESRRRFPQTLTGSERSDWRGQIWIPGISEKCKEESLSRQKAGVDGFLLSETKNTANIIDVKIGARA